MASKNDAGLTAERLQILTTTHSALQAARGSTVFESSGRATVFLTTISSSLIALGFIAQATRLSDSFYLFTYLFLACLAFIGWVTFQRLVQTGVEDVVWTRGIVRIVRSYVEHDPELRRFLAQQPGNGDATLYELYGTRIPALLFTTTASMVGVVTSVLLAVLAGLLAVRAAHGALWGAIATGVVVFLASASVHLVWERRRWRLWDKRVPQ